MEFHVTAAIQPVHTVTELGGPQGWSGLSGEQTIFYPCWKPKQIPRFTLPLHIHYTD